MKSDMATDELIRRSLAGGAEAFEALLDRHLARLVLLIHHDAGAAVAADAGEDDLCQVISETAWQHLASFETRGPGSFYRWLAQIARRVISDRVKYLNAKGRAEVRNIGSGVTHRPPFDSSTSVSKVVARREEIERFHASISCLAPDDRRVIECHFLEGRSLQDVADVLGVSKTTAWNRVKEATARLARALRSQ